MKTLNYINYFSVGLPAALLFGSIWNEELFFWGLISTIWTGLYQAVIGFKMALDSPENIWLRLYVFGVLIFFVAWIFTSFIYLWPVPPILAVYFSIVLFIEVKKEE